MTEPAGYPPGTPPPPGTTAVRPGSVTAAAIVLIILGALSAIFGVLMAIGGGAVGDLFGANLGGAIIVTGIVVLAFGIVEIVAGIRTLGLSPGWRIAGIVLAAVGGVVALIGVIGAFSGQQEFDFDTGQFTSGGLDAGSLILSLILLAANVFVIVGLARGGAAFRR